MCTDLRLHRLPGPVIFLVTPHACYVDFVLLETEKPGTADVLIASELREKHRKNKVLEIYLVVQVQCYARSPPCGANFSFCSLTYSYYAKQVTSYLNY